VKKIRKGEGMFARYAFTAVPASEDVLDTIEDDIIDEWWMDTLIFFSTPQEGAKVKARLEYLVHLGLAYRLACLFEHFFFKLLHTVHTG
jgi:hypothetical protein